MKWKLILAFPLLVVSGSFISVYYYFYQIDHKYDHLAKVISVPEQGLNFTESAAYQGPHPSTYSRPIDHSPSLIKIGEVGPAEALFSGPRQYPFLCNSEESGLGQPLVDNQRGEGMPIFGENIGGEKSNQIIGYSKDCLIPTRAWYYYQSDRDGRFYRLEKSSKDIVNIKRNGKEIPFIVRLEMGSINRFIYTIANLKGPDGQLDHPDASHWNKKLIYQFRGGVGVGRRQGVNKPNGVLKRRAEELKKGYAVIYSTANQTSNHYNIWLAEDTALRVKRQFNALYGAEDYVVGIGGSGGAIQQYLIAQNNPDFLDAAIALYSYPDMATQTIYAFDCELMEYYFDITDNQNNKWRNWKNRTLIEGLNASVGVVNKFSALYDFSLRMKGHTPPSPSGMSECSKSWRGVTQLVNNPRYFHFYQRFSDKVIEQTHWSHWEDLKYFYGVGKNGFALRTYDNVGVQYGLSAFVDGNISLLEFLELNARIGGWKQPFEMQAERYWKIGGESSLAEFSVWSEHNMTGASSSGLKLAPRTRGDISAMQGAYRSGHVFLGRLNIPVIDLRHYLDDELDMHHASASFSTRLRMIKAQGHAHNQIIWMTEKPYKPVADALEVIDQWLTGLKQVKAKNIQTALYLSRPENAKDRCYSKHGEIIAQGPQVWDGKWNNKINGECMKRYPIYSESRSVAGASLAGDTFKCALQSIVSAIAKGMYQPQNMKPHLKRLRQIFPQGVCDYSLPDVGRPSDIMLANSDFYIPEEQQNTEGRVGQ